MGVFLEVAGWVVTTKGSANAKCHSAGGCISKCGKNLFFERFVIVGSLSALKNMFEAWEKYSFFKFAC